MATSTIRIKKVCEFCGKEFFAPKATTRYCSTTCTVGLINTGGAFLFIFMHLFSPRHNPNKFGFCARLNENVRVFRFLQ